MTSIKMSQVDHKFFNNMKELHDDTKEQEAFERGEKGREDELPEMYPGVPEPDPTEGKPDDPLDTSVDMEALSQQLAQGDHFIKLDNGEYIEDKFFEDLAKLDALGFNISYDTVQELSTLMQEGADLTWYISNTDENTLQLAIKKFLNQNSIDNVTASMRVLATAYDEMPEVQLLNILSYAKFDMFDQTKARRVLELLSGGSSEYSKIAQNILALPMDQYAFLQSQLFEKNYIHDPEFNEFEQQHTQQMQLRDTEAPLQDSKYVPSSGSMSTEHGGGESGNKPIIESTSFEWGQLGVKEKSKAKESAIKNYEEFAADLDTDFINMPLSTIKPGFIDASKIEDPKYQSYINQYAIILPAEWPAELKKITDKQERINFMHGEKLMIAGGGTFVAIGNPNEMGMIVGVGKPGSDKDGLIAIRVVPTGEIVYCNVFEDEIRLSRDQPNIKQIRPHG